MECNIDVRILIFFFMVAIAAILSWWQRCEQRDLATGVLWRRKGQAAAGQEKGLGLRHHWLRILRLGVAAFHTQTVQVHIRYPLLNSIHLMKLL